MADYAALLDVEKKTAKPQNDKSASPHADKAARPLVDLTAKPLDRKTALEKAERYTVRLLPSLVKRLKDYAYFHNLKDKDVVQQALVEYFEKREKDR